MYLTSSQRLQSAGFAIKLQPLPRREQLVQALESVIEARQQPILAAVRHEGLVVGTTVSSLGDQIPLFAESLGAQLGGGAVTESGTVDSFLASPRDRLILVALGEDYQDKEHFQHSPPGQTHSWTTRVEGLRLSDRPVTRASAILWGRPIAGELLVSTFLGLSVHVRLDDGVGAAALEEKCGALAATLDAPYFWIFARSGVMRFERADRAEG